MNALLTGATGPPAAAAVLLLLLLVVVVVVVVVVVAIKIDKHRRISSGSVCRQTDRQTGNNSPCARKEGID